MNFESRRDLEDWLRQHGLAVRAARKIAAGGFAELVANKKDPRNELAPNARSARYPASKE